MEIKSKIAAGLLFSLISAQVISDTYVLRVYEEGINSEMTDKKSCKTILDNEPGLPSGNYELDTGTFYCDMDTDGGGWTQVFTDYYVGRANGPYYSDMSGAIQNFKDFKSNSLMIDLENRWFIMHGITESEFDWMWDSGHGHEYRNIASEVTTSIGKTYPGDSVVWQHWRTEIYELSENSGSWDENVIFDLGYDGNHGPAFWDNANGKYKRNGGYQTPNDLQMTIFVR